jgi:hypothetical protein
MPSNIVSRDARVEVVFALFPRLKEEPTCLVGPSLHFGLHTIGTELGNRAVRIHRRGLGFPMRNRN